MSSPKTITYARYVKAVNHGINPLPSNANISNVCANLTCTKCPYNIDFACIRTFTDIVELSKQHYQRALTDNPELFI